MSDLSFTIVRGRRDGVTLIEMIGVLAIAGVLLATAVSIVASTSDAMAVRSARTALASFQNQARTVAMERSSDVRLHLDPSQDVSVITVASDTLATLDFREMGGVDIIRPAAGGYLCITPKGYGRLSCSSYSTVVEVTFRRGQSKSEIALLPSGQIVFAPRR